MSEAGSRNRRSKGRAFEQNAAAYFTQLGFRILERNWRSGHKEIDLIVRKGNLVAFVEVKSSTTGKFGHPAERVDDQKIEHLTRAAQQYLIDHDLSGCDLRFDVVSFIGDKLEHFPDAFPAAE